MQQQIISEVANSTTGDNFCLQQWKKY